MEDDPEPPPDPLSAFLILPTAPWKSPRSAQSSTPSSQPAPDPDSSLADLSIDESHRAPRHLSAVPVAIGDGALSPARHASGVAAGTTTTTPKANGGSQLAAVAPSLSAGGAQAPSRLSSPSDKVELVDWEDNDDDDDDDDDDAVEEEVLLAESAPPSEAPLSAGMEAGCAVPAPSPGVAVHAGPGRGDRLKSVLVWPAAQGFKHPAIQTRLDRVDVNQRTPEDGQHSPRWQAAKTRRRERKAAIPLRAAMSRQEKARIAAREAFKKRLVGRCYRCFASDHLLAQCREPVRCWECEGVGHFARHCSARRKPISANLRSRITFPPDNIHSRISFPPLNHNPTLPHLPSNQSSSQPAPTHQAPHPQLIHSSSQPTTNHIVQQGPTRGRVNIVSTEGILHEANRLRRHAVVISAPQAGCCATAPEVAYALSGQLRVPRHDIKVIHFGTGLFLAEFDSPAVHDSAMRKRVVEIGGVAYPITPWAGQAMVINSKAAPTQIPGMSPTGLEGDRAVLIHLLGYEDWSTSSPVSGSSDHGSCEPRFVPFNWEQGALGGCCTHHDDNNEGLRSREEPRQRSSERSVPVCTRSPTYRQALMGEAGDDKLERGRTMSRSPARSVRKRGILTHSSEWWERRRSRSPPRYSVRSNVASHAQLYHDPLEEEMAAYEPQQEDRAFDPMIQESKELRSSSYQLPAICHSPNDCADTVESPVCRLASSSLVTGVALGQAAGEASGPAVQLPVETQVDVISDRVDTSAGSGIVLGQADGAAGGEDAREETKALGAVEDGEIADDSSTTCAAFCRKIFKEAPAPLLPRPQTLPQKGGRGRKRLMVATRSSLRQAARPSQVPVAQRAQQKLMRELQFMEDPTGPPDAAATEYLDLYGQNLSDEAVNKISKAARLGNKKLVEALAAVAAEMGAMGMEAP